MSPFKPQISLYTTKLVVVVVVAYEEPLSARLFSFQSFISAFGLTTVAALATLLAAVRRLLVAAVAALAALLATRRAVRVVVVVVVAFWRGSVNDNWDKRRGSRLTTVATLATLLATAGLLALAVRRLVVRRAVAVVVVVA